MRRNNAMGSLLGTRPTLGPVLPVILLGLCLFLGGLCALAPGRVHAEGWVTLAAVERVTFYGPRYVAGMVTASGIRYAPENDIVALGPDLLGAVRAHYSRLADELGQPLLWRHERNGRVIYQGVAGSFPVLVDWHRAVWWGYLVRLCAETADGGELCQELRVADTGKPALQADLPDATWKRWGWPSGRGVFAGRLEVLE